MSTWGRVFRVTTFGESHGGGVGCVIDGVPPGMSLTADDIQPQLDRRRPGQSILTTQRQETDKVHILSGTEAGKTLGTPVALVVYNEDQRKFDYAETSKVPRPGHADLTYRVKYGTQASSGGGRASARETAARVAAGSVAEKWLKEQYNTTIVSFVSAVQNVEIPEDMMEYIESSPVTREEVDSGGTVWKLSDGRYINDDNTLFDGETGEPLGMYPDEYPKEDVADVVPGAINTRCPHTPAAVLMATLIQKLREAGDSTGGIVTTIVKGVPSGLGEPCFDKTEAELAKAMMSLPATKGFEIGDGFRGTRLTGSQHNDRYTGRDAKSSLLESETNHSGGTYGGITSGANLVFRVAFKPVSSIGKEQKTCSYDGAPSVLGIKGRHDPCVLPRTPPLVEAMTALVLMDLTMLQRARQATIPLSVLPLKPRMLDCPDSERQ